MSHNFAQRPLFAVQGYVRRRFTWARRDCDSRRCGKNAVSTPQRIEKLRFTCLKFLLQFI